VAAASDEQARGIGEINAAVGQMDQVTQQVAANAEESAAASEELSAQAEQLNQIVAELAQMVGGSKGTRSETVARKSPPTIRKPASAVLGGARRGRGAAPATSSGASDAGRRTRSGASGAVSAKRSEAEQSIPLEEPDESVLAEF
jgi:methyl-accepting chemotaxis protein